MSRKRSMIQDSILPNVKHSRELRRRARYAANVLGELGIHTPNYSEQVQRVREQEKDEIKHYIMNSNASIILQNIQELARLAR